MISDSLLTNGFGIPKFPTRKAQGMPVLSSFVSILCCCCCCLLRGAKGEVKTMIYKGKNPLLLMENIEKFARNSVTDIKHAVDA